MTTPIDRDFKSDPASGELVFINGDLAMVSGLDAIRQDVEERLGYVRGDWFLDPEDPIAVPMFEDVLGRKPPNAAVIRAIYEKAILATPGVSAVLALTVEIDRATRTARVRFTASTDLGEIAVNVSVGG
jgi:hypothetical protein